MPYITREDGEHFVIPSYRDVLSSKRKSQLKKDILLLSQSYGEYITMQRKNNAQYEVAFSPDTGYLLGESFWHYFKRPMDMIYCEAIPNTTEAILVIVKNGSVYLDGSFPIESIPEELVIFLTQQNNFDIYVYGDVPIAQTPTEDKFSFDPTSVKSFTVLEKPVFPSLPLLRIYQLQLVDQVLKAHSIGVFPTKQLLLGLIAFGLLWMMYSYMTSQKTEVEVVEQPEVDPYQGYKDAMNSPAPDKALISFVSALQKLYTMPGWDIQKIDYSGNALVVSVSTPGGKVQTLEDWAKKWDAFVEVKSDGIYVTMTVDTPIRTFPKQMVTLQDTLEALLDRLETVYPGNHLKIEEPVSRGAYSDQSITITIENASPALLIMIAQQLADLPFVLKKISLTKDDQGLSGSINLTVLGT